MTTLGALSVGLLVLVLIVAAGIALLARSQRRAPRGPEQPRTVADLVRMRESAAEERAAAAGASAAIVPSAQPVGETPEALPAESPASSPLVGPSAEAEEARRVPPSPVEPESEATTELLPPAQMATSPELGPVDGPEVVEGPELDPAPSGPLQDTPWARAARMADPLGEWTASARAAREREETADPRPAVREVPKARTPRKDVVPPPRLSLFDPNRATPLNETTTIAHLPKGFGQNAEAERAAVEQAAAAERAAAEQAAAAERAAAEHAAAVERAAAEQAAAAERAAAERAAVEQAAAAERDAAEQAAAAAERAEAERAAAAEQGDDETVSLAGPPGGGATSPASAHPDDSVTVTFAPPVLGRPNEPAGPTPEPPDEPTGPVDPSAFALVGTAPEPAAGSVATKLLTPVDVAPLPTPARVAGRVRRSPADTAAEQAAADLALLRTFGVAGPGRTAAADDTEVELEGCSPDDAEPSAGAAQPVTFRVVDRDGRGLAGASVTLLDDHGREISGTTADQHGAGTLTARRPGGYMLVTAAEGYQPGAVTIAVADGPVDTEIPLTRSASIVGSVCGEDGPIVGAHLVLVQDGEIVDTTESCVDGAYVFADLAAGEYGLSITASECEPAAVVLRLDDEATLRHDVDLDPVGLPVGGATGDVMIGHL